MRVLTPMADGSIGELPMGGRCRDDVIAMTGLPVSLTPIPDTSPGSSFSRTSRSWKRMVVGMKLRDRRRLARELLYCRGVPSVDFAAGTCGSGTLPDADDRRR